MLNFDRKLYHSDIRVQHDTLLKVISGLTRYSLPVMGNYWCK